MNELDRYAVSLENMEVLRAQVAEQAREIAAMKAKPSGVLLPERLATFQDDDPGRVAFSRTWNACLDEVARLNQPASAGDENSEEGLEEWANGKFGIGGRYTGKLYGNTDWALARVVWSAALSRAAPSAVSQEQG